MMHIHPALSVSQDTDFSIHNIPFGIGRIPNVGTRVCTRVGDHVLDLAACCDLGLLREEGLRAEVLKSDSLNAFISLGKSVTSAVREEIQRICRADSPKEVIDQLSTTMYAVEEVEMLLPVEIGDYTDFYSSREHATNLGKMFRDPENALLPNWLHIPVGYHGRASSIVVSGTSIRRPKGQMLPPDSDRPVFGPTRLLDIELEMAFIVGKSNPLGTPISIEEAEEYIFGMVLFNDWSARDIQKWEYVPLGPFLGKNFASTLSPWVVTMEALAPFRVPGPKQEPEVLPYLKVEGKHNYDIDLFVDMENAEGAKKTIAHSNFKYMYWNILQQLAHHTVNGCNMKVGDVCASGTISGPHPGSYGSLLEITWRGSQPITLPDGSERTFLQDGDVITLRGFSQKGGVRVGFGQATGRILPAL